LFEPFLEITANAYCDKDAPWVHYEVNAVGFVPGLATIEWLDADNAVVQTLTDRPLSGDILWPEAAVDGDGRGLAWPGWEFVGGAWVTKATKVRPQATLRISVNPTAEVVLDYPPVTPDCACEPYVSLGNLVFFDADANGRFNAGDSGVDGVTLELWSPGPDGQVGGGDDAPVDLDPNTSGVQNAVVTAAGGYYLFRRVPSAKYFVRVPADEFAAGAELEGTVSSAGQGNDGVTDHPDDENGVDDPTPETNGIVSSVIEVQATQTSIADLDVGPLSGQADASENLTLDFGFREAPPTAASLDYFRATQSESGVRLNWRTLVEVEVLGFHLERENAAGLWQRLTIQVIPATGGDVRPQAYAFSDAAGANAVAYRLIEVASDGRESVLAQARPTRGLAAQINHEAGVLTLRFQGWPDSTAVVQAAPTVLGPWTTLQTVRFDRDGQGILEVTVEPAGPARFFRTWAE
jgi:hypothetical protein